MKVTKCSAAVPKQVPAPKTYSRTEIEREEGVYKVADADGIAQSRVVVLRYNNDVVTLFYGANSGCLEPLGKDSWPNTRFVKVENATVCFEIRE